MSKTMYIEYHGEGFWAYDVAVGVFLKHLIDQACLHNQSNWLGDCVELWRLNAVVSDFGMHLNHDWSDTERKTVQVLIGEACQELKKINMVSADEAASWRLHAGQGVCLRGEAQVSTAPAIELGKAVSLLLEGSLPAAPPGYWWFYGASQDITTIKKKEG